MLEQPKRNQSNGQGNPLLWRWPSFFVVEIEEKLEIKSVVFHSSLYLPVRENGLRISRYTLEVRLALYQTSTTAQTKFRVGHQ